MCCRDRWDGRSCHFFTAPRRSVITKTNPVTKAQFHLNRGTLFAIHIHAGVRSDHTPANHRQTTCESDIPSPHGKTVRPSLYPFRTGRSFPMALNVFSLSTSKPALKANREFIQKIQNMIDRKMFFASFFLSRILIK